MVGLVWGSSVSERQFDSFDHKAPLPVSQFPFDDLIDGIGIAFGPAFGDFEETRIDHDIWIRKAADRAASMLDRRLPAFR